MSYFSKEHETICALATPGGVGGIGVLRLSGTDSLSIGRKVARFIPLNPESHKIFYGRLCDLSTGETIDEALVSYFAQGKSFTGEQTLEFSCHGSPAVLDLVLNQLIAAGARLARPGEFSFRAFRSGKIDLTQAEAVADLIESQSKAQARNAIRHLEGQYSKELRKTLNQITKWASHVEADIDFSEEGLSTLNPRQMSAEIKETIGHVKTLTESFAKGKLLKEGFKVAFAGAPNVGKSSLLNAVLDSDRALVSSTAGTTRDLIESWIEVSGVRVSLNDTAGLRETEDEVERLGIQKTWRSLESCDLVFYVFDLSQGLSRSQELEILEIQKKCSGSVLLLGNKRDLCLSQEKKFEQIQLSALAPEDSREQIVQEITKQITKAGAQEGFVVTRLRHFESLLRLIQALESAETCLVKNESSEFVALGLKEALLELHQLLGTRLDEQVIDRIFKEFCLGK